MKAVPIGFVLALAISAPMHAQDDMTSVRSCTEAMNRSGQAVSMYGSEGVVDICKCAVPMIAAKYSVADQVRLNGLPKTRGSVFASRDAEFQTYIGLQTDAGAKCARNVADPGGEEREARELAERNDKRRADSARWAADDAARNEAAAARASSPVEVMRRSLGRVGALQGQYYFKVGSKRCMQSRDRNCSVYFSSLAELRASWAQVSERPWPGDEYFEPSGVKLQFKVSPSEWVVSATHDSTPTGCSISEPRGPTSRQVTCK